LARSFFRKFASRTHGEDRVAGARSPVLSEELLELAIDGADLGVWILDVPSQKLEANDRLAGMIGYTVEELGPLSFETWKNLVEPGDFVNASRLVQECLDGRLSPYECVFRMKHKDGHLVPILARGTVVERDESGEPLRMAGTHLDVTRREAADRALKESERALRTIFDNTHDAIFVHSADGTVLDVNEKMLALYGVTREEALHMSIVGDFSATGNPLDDLPEIWRLVLAGTPQMFEWRARRPKDGSAFDVEVSLERIVLREQTVILANVRDISDRKRAEAERIRFEEQIRQSQKMEAIGRLAGGVAHDFNNMLGVILGHVDLAMSGLDPHDAVAENLEEIRSAARRSADLTRQLLGFARKQPIAPRPLDLNETVTGMLSMIRRLIGENIGLRWSPGADLWSVRIDPTQLDQVLANLCVNARDAIGASGSIAIATGRRSSSGPSARRRY